MVSFLLWSGRCVVSSARSFYAGNLWVLLFALLQKRVCAMCNRISGKGGAKQMSSRSGRWPVVRKMAWDRDRKARAVCHICGQPINYHLPPSSAPDAWEPDHLIPVARDPSRELDLRNIQASHMRCNRTRGDGTNGENILGMQSRIW